MVSLEELEAAGFNREWEYHFWTIGKSYNVSLSDFPKIERLQEIIDYHGIQGLKRTVRPVMMYNLYARDFKSEYYFLGEAQFFKYLEDDGKVRTVDDLIFVLNTATWYHERKLFCFWTDNEYCIYRATTKQNSRPWVQEPLEKWIKKVLTNGEA